MSKAYLIPFKRLNSREIVVAIYSDTKKSFSMWDFSNVEFISRSAAQEIYKLLTDRSNEISIVNESKNIATFLNLIKSSKKSRINRTKIVGTKYTQTSISQL